MVTLGNFGELEAKAFVTQHAARVYPEAPPCDAGDWPRVHKARARRAWDPTCLWACSRAPWAWLTCFLPARAPPDQVCGGNANALLACTMYAGAHKSWALGAWA